MSIKQLTAFFMWNTIINASILIFTFIIFMCGMDWIYSLHGQIFNINHEHFNLFLYGFLSVYKMFIFIFNLVPFLALLIIGKRQRRKILIKDLEKSAC